MLFIPLTCCELGALLGLGCGTVFVVDWLPATEPVRGSAVVVGGTCCLGCCFPCEVRSLTYVYRYTQTAQLKVSDKKLSYLL